MVVILRSLLYVVVVTATSIGGGVGWLRFGHDRWSRLQTHADKDMEDLVILGYLNFTIVSSSGVNFDNHIT